MFPSNFTSSSRIGRKLTLSHIESNKFHLTKYSTYTKLTCEQSIACCRQMNSFSYCTRHMLAACKALRPFHIFGHLLSRTFRAITIGDTVSDKMISLHNLHTTHTVQSPPAAREMYENRTTSANFTSHRFAGPVRCPKFQWGREVRDHRNIDAECEWLLHAVHPYPDIVCRNFSIRRVISASGITLNLSETIF